MDEDLEELIRDTNNRVIRIEQSQEDQRRRIEDLEDETCNLWKNVRWNKNKIYLAMGGVSVLILATQVASELITWG